MTDYVINEKRMNALRLELHPDIIKDLCSHPLSAELKRERVLKGILMAMNDPQLSICDTGYLEHAYWRDYIKSLRGGSE